MKIEERLKRDEAISALWEDIIRVADRYGVLGDIYLTFQGRTKGAEDNVKYQIEVLTDLRRTLRELNEYGSLLCVDPVELDKDERAERKENRTKFEALRKRIKADAKKVYFDKIESADEQAERWAREVAEMIQKKEAHSERDAISKVAKRDREAGRYVQGDPWRAYQRKKKLVGKK